MRLAKTGLFKRREVPSEGIRPELFLHRSVLDRALLDLFSSYKDIREDVESWLDLKNPDFRECCEMALFEPEKVYKTFITVKSILDKDDRKRKTIKFKKY